MKSKTFTTAVNTDQKFQLLYTGPIFTHYFPNIWIDYRGLQDDYLQGRGLDYFENSCRATYVHRQYAIQNLSGFAGYEEHVWGITRRQE